MEQNLLDFKTFDFSKIKSLSTRKIVLWEISKYIILLRRYDWGQPYPVFKDNDKYPSHLKYEISNIPNYISELIVNNLIQQAPIYCSIEKMTLLDLKSITKKYNIKGGTSKSNILSLLRFHEIPESEYISKKSFEWLYETTYFAKDFLKYFEPLTTLIYSDYLRIEWYINLCAQAGYLIEIEKARELELAKNIKSPRTAILRYLYN